MIDFLFIYEHKVRELDNLCLLSAVLEMRGYSVQIINRFDYDRNQSHLLAHKPHVVGIVAAYGEHTLFTQMYRYVGAGVRKIVNFRWEQVLAKSEIEKGARSFHMPKGEANRIVHVCWGREPQRQLLENGNAHAVITGALQMDFLTPHLRGLYMNKRQLCERYGLPQGRLALYISTFAYATLSPEALHGLETMTGNSLAPSAALQRKAQAMTLDALEKLLERFPDLTVVYRPHPAEASSEIVANMAARCPRFHVIGEQSVKQWILAADHVITWVSTSVAEAYFAGVNVTLYRPCETPELSDPVIFQGCTFCATPEELIARMQCPASEFPVDPAMITAYYDVDPNRLACQRMADLFEAVYRTAEYDHHDAHCSPTALVKSWLAGVLRRLLSHAQNHDWLCDRIWPFTTQKKAMAEYERFKGEIASEDEIAGKVAMYRHALEQAE